MFYYVYPAHILKWNQLLKCVNMRLVVCVEDIDRNNEDRDSIVRMAALLDRLNRLDNVTCVLAIGRTHQNEDLLVRLSEKIEIVGIFDRTKYIKLAKILFYKCFDTFSADIVSYDKDERLKQLSYDNIDEMIDVSNLMPFIFCVRLYSCIRLYKCFMRRVWNTWKTLHGEIDLGELIVLSTLRECAFESFRFLCDNYERIRNMPLISEKDKREKEKKEIRSIYDNYTRNVMWDKDAAWYLIDYVLPALERGYNSTSLQGVGSRFGKLYFKRIVREEIGDKEIRDQDVMCVLKNWNENSKNEKCGDINIPDSINEVEGVAEKVYQFHQFLNLDKAKNLVSRYHDYVSVKNKVEKEYRGFDVMVKMLDDMDKDKHKEWVIEEVSRVLKSNLELSTDIYEKYSSQEFLNNLNVREVRQAHVSRAKKFVNCDVKKFEKIMKHCSSYDVLYRFVVKYSEQKYGGDGFKIKEWEWLSYVLIKGTEVEPNWIIPYIIIMFVEFSDYNSPKYTFNNENFNEMFGDKSKDVFKAIVDYKVNEDSFKYKELKMIECAKQEAERWLKEKENKVPLENVCGVYIVKHALTRV